MTNIISQKELKRVLHYCPDTGVFTNLISRSGAAKVGSEAGSIDKQGYRVMWVLTKRYKAHRLAFLYMLGKFPIDQVDHINHVRDDNRWCNLRHASYSDNSRNRSDVIGVYKYGVNKWRARIRVDGKLLCLGIHTSITAAAIARKAAEIKYGFHPNHGG